LRKYITHQSEADFMNLFSSSFRWY